MDPRLMRVSVITTAAVMIIGAVGTWASASVFGTSISVSGTDGGRDGVIIIACAVLLAIAALAQNRFTGVVGLLAAIAAAATCIYDLTDIQGTDGLTVGWGLWVALVGSVVAVLDAVWLLAKGGRKDDEAPPAAPPADHTLPGVPND
jgi:hypothetical protein